MCLRRAGLILVLILVLNYFINHSMPGPSRSKLLDDILYSIQ